MTLTHGRLAWSQVDDDAPDAAAPPLQKKHAEAEEEGDGDTMPGDFLW